MEQVTANPLASFLRAQGQRPPGQNRLAGVMQAPQEPRAQDNALFAEGGPTRAAAGRADLARGIMEAANELGMDPVDMAAIISYETGGTFDPAQPGPTTKWGQHRGLIQFGEPQADQYGVDWSDPAGSQLGRDGAVVRYFRDRGYRPGMELLDAYSIVNAGAPGRYGASDEAAGGAPGTVRDKVDDQMGRHRRNARSLLGLG